MPHIVEDDCDLPAAKRIKPNPMEKHTFSSSKLGSSTSISSTSSMESNTDHNINSLSLNSPVVPSMDVDHEECPCGFLHGPNQGHHSDLSARGFSNIPLLRGPD